jgi:hypothetical protein
MKRFDAVDAEGVDVFRVVAPSHGATVAGSKPCVRFTPGDFVAEDMEGEDGLLQAERVDCGDGTGGDGVLRVIVSAEEVLAGTAVVDAVDIGELGGEWDGISGTGG